MTWLITALVAVYRQRIYFFELVFHLKPMAIY